MADHIEYNLDVTLECINELKSLKSALDEINVADQTIMSSGQYATEMQNVLQSLLQYKKQLSNLIVQSHNFAACFYNNVNRSEQASSVSGRNSTSSSNEARSSGGSSGNTTPVDTGNEIKLPTQRWNPTIAKYVSDETNRSPEVYKKVVEQFDVVNSERYKRDSRTWCNIFVWDVTSAMGAEIPHWYDPVTGEATAVGAKGAYEMSASRMVTWMENFGEQNGWIEVSAEEAQRAANSGFPTVALMDEHVAMVVPTEDGYDVSDNGPMTTQAGATNFENKPARQGFGKKMSEVKYYIHA